MKQSKILDIKIQNFKGIANGTFNFKGENTEIVADVMQGKSTIKDAYLWCFGVEVDNFYPCNKNNQLIEGLETRVELTLDIDGIEYVLSRSAKVKYKNKVFDGFKKDMYEFDRVPCNTTEYKTKLCDLLGVSDFDTLKYLTILNYFNEQVSWKERRELIYNLFVDKTAIDSLKDNPKYDLIRNELLKGKSSADISTMLNSENNRLVDSKRKNEILLVDKQSELATFENINYDNIESELALVETQISEEQKRIDSLNKQSIVHDINSKIWDLKEELRKFRFDDGGKIRVLEQRNHYLKNDCEELKDKGTNLEKQIETLTAEYKELKVAQFDESNTICPTCHQPLKQADIDELRATWVNNQESRLTSLKTEILNLKALYEQVKEDYTTQLSKLEVAQQELADFKPNPKIDELLGKIKELESELEKCETQPIDTSYLTELKDRRNFLIVELGKKDSHEKLKAKIDQLVVEQRELVNQEIALAKKRSQLEQYTLDIIALVNDSINSHFEGVKFKLFEELTATASKNIKETCLVTHNGIEYGSCSTGEKALVNLIIVSTLQKKLNTTLPLFADDASILNIKNPPKTQIVYLVNEKGRELSCVKIKDLY